MKLVALTIALLSCAVLEQAMQTRELRQTADVCSSVAQKVVLESITASQREPIVHQMEGVDALLDFFECE